MALRYFVEDFTEASPGVLKSATPDDDIVAPTGHTAVLESTIRAVYAGAILLFGKWNGLIYTPPAGYVAPFDPTSVSGAVKKAAHDMLNVFDAAIGLMLANPDAWPSANVQNALSGIHWQIIAAARVSLNSTRTAARRQKFCEECASWPTGLSGDPRQYVDGMGSADPGEKWSWVDPETDPFDRKSITDAASSFENATNVEDAPGSDDLIGRGWINDIPA